MFDLKKTAILTLLFSSAACFTATADENLSICINNEAKSFQPNAYIESGTTMVPMRAIFEELGAAIDYDAETKTITASKDGTVVELRTGSKNAKINNSPYTMTVPVANVNGSTMIPLRFVSEALGANVGWDADSKRIDIFLEGSIPAVKETVETDDRGWVDAYAAELEKNTTNGQSVFALAYVDDNNIPELLINTAEIHAAPGLAFTYYGGELKDLGVFGGFGHVAYSERTSLFFGDNGMNRGVATCWISKLENGEVVTIKEFMSALHDSETEFSVDGNNVSKSEYEQLFHEAYDAHTWTELTKDNGFNVTAENIKKFKENPDAFFIK